MKRWLYICGTFEAADRLCTRRHVYFAAREDSILQSVASMETQRAGRRTGAEVSGNAPARLGKQMQLCLRASSRVGVTLLDAG